MRYLDRLQPLALLVMRLALGAVMFDHGYHKVFGRLRHHAQFFASPGLAAWSAYLSSFSEFFGGLLVLLGLFTRVAAFAICVDLVVAIVKVHLHNGLMGPNGYELPLALAALAFGLIFLGAGPIAFDHIRAPGPESSGNVSSHPQCLSVLISWWNRDPHTARNLSPSLGFGWPIRSRAVRSKRVEQACKACAKAQH